MQTGCLIKDMLYLNPKACALGRKHFWNATVCVMEGRLGDRIMIPLVLQIWLHREVRQMEYQVERGILWLRHWTAVLENQDFYFWLSHCHLALVSGQSGQLELREAQSVRDQGMKGSSGGRMSDLRRETGRCNKQFRAWIWSHVWKYLIVKTWFLFPAIGYV